MSLVELSRQRHLAGSQGLGDKLASIGLALLRSGAAQQSETLLRESLAICNEHEPETWKKYSLMASIGQSQHEQWKAAGLMDAEANTSLDGSNELLSSAESLLRDAIAGFERPEHAPSPVHGERLLEYKTSLAEVQLERSKDREVDTSTHP